MCFFSVLDRARTAFQKYKRNFVIPYFVFIRDMFSYLALLGLHFAICVQPSQLKFSNLEWAILVFLFGRLLIEIKQCTDTCCNRSKGGQIKLNDMSSYVRYRNLFIYLPRLSPPSFFLSLSFFSLLTTETTYLLLYLFIYFFIYTKGKQFSNTCEMFAVSLTQRFFSAKRLVRDL